MLIVRACVSARLTDGISTVLVPLTVTLYGPPGSSRDRGPASRGDRVSQSVLDRYDKDKDGKLSEAERAEFLRAREERRKKR